MMALLVLRSLLLFLTVALLVRLWKEDRVFAFRRKGMPEVLGRESPFCVLVRVWFAMVLVFVLANGGFIFIEHWREMPGKGWIPIGSSWKILWDGFETKGLFVLSASVFPSYVRFIKLKRPVETPRNVVLLSLAALPLSVALPLGALALSVLLEGNVAVGYVSFWPVFKARLGTYFPIFTALADPVFLGRFLWADPSPLLCAYLFPKVLTQK